ncbi:helix-hairpin-helix domain-containing protein [bacterium]|nr:helix-hairpin-helix domain-containing protein [bacterium]
MQNKNMIIIAILILIGFLGAIFINGLFKNGIISNNSNKTNIEDININTEVLKEKTTKPIIIVEIKGEVLYPGIYEFDLEEVLIKNVIDMAGGLTKRADTSSINLASIVENHSSIKIGSIESKSYILGEGEELKKTNINTAEKEDLMALEGVGEVKAIQIINYRRTNGFFQSIEDIKKVNGIGDALFEKIKEYITV